MDTDDNFRVMCYEVKDSIRWLLATLKDTTGINEGSTSLTLANIDTSKGDGPTIYAAASKILRELKQPDAEVITLEQVRKVEKLVEEMPVSSSGVILPEGAKSKDVSQFISDIIETTGGSPHPIGKNGASEENLETFLKEANARLDWHDKALLPEPTSVSDVMPLGTATHKAYEPYQALKDKLDQYFAQCRATAFDQRTAAHFLPSEEKLASSDFKDAQAVNDLLKESPLATPHSGRSLRFSDDLNPAYADSLQRFRMEIMLPLTDNPKILSENDWNYIKKAFHEHEKWVAS